MSSFVINKEEYTKAGAFLSALVETKTSDAFHEPILRLWNKKEHRICIATDIIKDFNRLYIFNVKSVNLQYQDNIEPNTNDFTSLYNSFKDECLQLLKKGYTYREQPEQHRLRVAIYKVINFFECIRYQIEDEELEIKALRILNKYYRELYKILKTLEGFERGECFAWGDFNINTKED
jgi:hypothetical protein